MSEPHNPVEVERRIFEVLNLIAEGINVRTDRYAEWLQADAAYDRAHAKAYVDAAGPVHVRSNVAELATADERYARDVADVAYKHAERRAKSLEAELSALQSVLKSMLATYGAAGVGER